MIDAYPPPPPPCTGSNQPGQRRTRNHGRKGHFGHVLQRKKKEHTIRILLQNIGGIGFITEERSKETLKMERLKEVVINHAVDIFCLTEVNKDWRLLPYDQTIWVGTSGWTKNRRLQISQNYTVPPSTRSLIGGTATCCLEDTVFRICSQGADKRELGR